MRKKYMLPFTIFILSVIVLFGPTPVWSDVNLNDTLCTDEEKANNYCIESIGYVVQIYIDENTNEPIIMEDGVSNYNWPIKTENGTLIWRYKGFVSNVTECKGSTWNYVIEELHQCVATNFITTDPPGAQLLLPGDYARKCNSFTADPDNYLVKLNPSLNCGEGNEVIFHFETPNTVPAVGPNRFVFATKQGCSPIPLERLLGPDISEVPKIESWTSCRKEIKIIKDVCTDEVTCVEIGGKQAQPCNPYLVLGDLEDPIEVINLREEEQVGPGATGGIFTCEPFAIIGYGEEYYCESPDGTPPCPE